MQWFIIIDQQKRFPMNFNEFLIKSNLIKAGTSYQKKLLAIDKTVGPVMKSV